MKDIFVDTNILIDLLGNRKPYSKFATLLFHKAEIKQVRLYTSSHSIATSYYILNKHIEDKKLRVLLNSLLDFLHIIPIDFHILKRGLASQHKDFEDALQILSAMTIPDIDLIVTRNLKDFKRSEIPAFPPDEVLNKL